MVGAFDTIFGIAALVIGVWLLRLTYVLFRLSLSGTSDLGTVSGSVKRVFMGEVDPWIDGKRNPGVSAGMYFKETDSGGEEHSQGFVSDEVLIKRIREIG